MARIKISIIDTDIGIRTHLKGFYPFPDDAIKESADKDADIDFNEETNSYC